MKRSDILKELMEREILDKDEYIILADGFEPAFMGISAQKPKRVIYDYWKCLDVIIRRDNAEFDEALDWLDEFIEEELGDHAPIYIKQI
tara:strand:- start:28 stop:294 length:267 start_codon:yes stop_codon:yes gene_type:complete